MKSKKLILFIILIALSAADAYSQVARGPDSNDNMVYAVNKVETIPGQVRSIENIYSLNNTSYDIQMIIYTVNGDISVHLGPTSYLVDQNLKISVNDNVIVTGSRMNYLGNFAIIAKDVTKDGQVLKLRDENGNPLWLGKAN
jgi:hypothetical protein